MEEKKQELLDMLDRRHIVLNNTIGPDAMNAVQELKEMDAKIKELLFWCEQDANDIKAAIKDERNLFKTKVDYVALEAERRRKIAEEYDARM